ncbi:MAG: M20/M25/M40 family metallo-hydrolase [Candidatus Peribacteraceae bacterium]|nr:M20/M25/M40 family metallo-hydrolase [Candidatus Peribacteraceae bacterium]
MKHSPSLPSLERLLCELIAVRSVSSDAESCGIALSICRNCLRDLPGVVIHEHTKDGQPSLVILSHDTPEPDVLLVCHVDVVPAPSASFAPDVKDGRITGRGAIDMKGPTSAMIRAFHRHVSGKGTASVGIMISTDEEVGGHRGIGYLMSEKGYRAHCAVLPDAGYDFRLVTLQYGIVRVRIRRKGKAAHSSRPEEGVNAIDSFQESYAVFRKRIKKIPETVSTLVTINAGIALNVVPDLCDATIDIRTARAPAVLTLIADVFREHEYEVFTTEPSLRIDPKNPFIRSFRRIAERELKRPMRLTELRGATDARYLAPYNIPVIISSPKGNGHHEDYEWVDIASLKMFEDVTVKFLNSIKR